MADDRAHEQPGDDRTYEPPAVEPLGFAEELAKGNEGSPTDTVGDAE
jgi:hypothetical protein